jgi:hypothetical protein
VARREGQRRWLVVLVGMTMLATAGALTLYVQNARADRNGPTALAPTPPGTLRPVPTFSHVTVVVMENKSFEAVVGSPQATRFNALRSEYASLDAYQGIAHPSQPNYIAMAAGSTHGVLDNRPVDVSAPTVFDQLEQHGRDWRVYAENMPPGCFTGASALDGRDGPGEYVRKHNPAISFIAIQRDPARCAKIGDLTAFDPGAADLEIVIPNMCHDSHDCPLETADAWLGELLAMIMASTAYLEGGVIFVVFEESNDRQPRNHVPAIVISETVIRGHRSSVPHTHYSLLRTLQEAWSLPCLASSCEANTFGEVFASD